MRRTFRRAYSSASVASIRWPRPWNVSGATSSHSVLRARRISPSASDSEPGYRAGSRAAVSPAVGEHEVGGHPHDVAQVRRGLEGDRADALERHPVVAAVDHRLAHGPEARVGVGDPLERLAVDRAGHRLGLLHRFGAERLRLGRPAGAAAARAWRSRATHGSGSPSTSGVRVPGEDSRRSSSQLIAAP